MGKWQDKAACIAEVERMVDMGWSVAEAHNEWHPPGERYQSRYVEHAKTICNGGWLPEAFGGYLVPPCPVREQCLKEHLFEKHGVFGGLTPDERRKLVKDGKRGRRELSQTWAELDYLINAGIPPARWADELATTPGALAKRLRRRGRDDLARLVDRETRYERETAKAVVA